MNAAIRGTGVDGFAPGGYFFRLECLQGNRYTISVVPFTRDQMYTLASRVRRNNFDADDFALLQRLRTGWNPTIAIETNLYKQLLFLTDPSPSMSVFSDAALQEVLRVVLNPDSVRYVGTMPNLRMHLFNDPILNNDGTRFTLQIALNAAESQMPLDNWFNFVVAASVMAMPINMNITGANARIRTGAADFRAARARATTVQSGKRKVNVEYHGRTACASTDAN